MASSAGTTSSVGIAANGVFSRRPRSRASWIQGGIFFLFALELFVLASVVWAHVVLNKTFVAVHDQRVSLYWCLLAVLAASWGTVYFAQAWKASLAWQRATAARLLAIALASGAVLIGVLIVVIARTGVFDPYLLDATAYYPAQASAVATGAAAAGKGNPANGKSLFVTTCATCHGPTGQGIAGNAPSLRISSFIKSSDEATIASLIRGGRAATDPANKTGKVMPARGGNPFLDEAKIGDLAAFLKDLENQLGASSDSADAAAADATPTVQLSRWIIPASTENLPQDLTTSPVNQVFDFTVQTACSAQRRYESSVSRLFVVTSSVLAFHYLWVIALGCGVVLQRELGIGDATRFSLMRHAYLFWIVGAVILLIWFVMFVIFS